MKETDSILKIKGIGEKAQQKFQKLDIYTVGDLLEHYPRNYDVYKPLCPIRDLVEGEVSAIEGVLDSLPKVQKVRNLKILNCSISDGTGDTQVSFFQEYKYKLEHIYDKFYTARGVEIARQRQSAAVAFYNSMLEEIQSSYENGKQRLLEQFEK